MTKEDDSMPEEDWNPQYPDEEFLRALRGERPGGEPQLIGTTQVADEVGCNEVTALRRLTRLYEQGRVNRITVGSHYAWQVNDDNDVDS